MSPLKTSTNPSLQHKGMETPTTDGLVGKLRGLFKRKAQNTAINGHEAASPKQTDILLEQEQEREQEQKIALWSNHRQIQSQIPRAVISKTQLEHALKVLQYCILAQDTLASETYDLPTAIKTVFLHSDTDLELFNQYPQLSTIIPDTLYQDHIFMLALQKFKPDFFTVLTIATFRPFTQVHLFDPISNGLKNNWVVMEYLRDQKIVVMKEGLIRQTIDLSDLWVLNSQVLENYRKVFLNGDKALEEFEKILTEQQMMNRIMPALEDTPENFPESTVSAVIQPREEHTRYDVNLQTEDRTNPDKASADSPEKKGSAPSLISYNREMLGLKFTLNHADHGTLSLIATDITSDHLTFVIIEGPYIGRYMQVEAERVTQYLVPGNPDMRFLNTNILQVKK
ncbi:hypothetical protein HOH51_02025 [bacterium]|jgi:hypothetical protein|nr:hypothetical protein [bacterium]